MDLQPTSRYCPCLRQAQGYSYLRVYGRPSQGTLVAVIELLTVFLHVGDPLIYVLLGTFGAALVLLGPGAWSVDARLFGWKRIDLRDPQE